MLKRFIYISLVLVMALWAWPAKAGVSYGYPYSDCRCDSGMGQWYGVPNMGGFDANYGMGNWYGVRNDVAYPSYHDPLIGNWYGVNNTRSLDNPFGDWYGVNNMGSSDPFGGWYGVNNMSSDNPFGNWYGVSSSQQPTTTYPVSYQTANQAYTPVSYAYQTSEPYRVAPLTGTNQFAPFAFAGLLAAGLFVVRKRKWLFN